MKLKLLGQLKDGDERLMEMYHFGSDMRFWRKAKRKPYYVTKTLILDLVGLSCLSDSGTQKHLEVPCRIIAPSLTSNECWQIKFELSGLQLIYVDGDVQTIIFLDIWRLFRIFRCASSGLLFELAKCDFLCGPWDSNSQKRTPIN
jgi:hypothetical protein